MVEKREEKRLQRKEDRAMQKYYEKVEKSNPKPNDILK